MPKKNGKTTVDEQNSYFSHLSGKRAIRKTGEAKFDPDFGYESHDNAIEIKSARGSDLDTILLAATAQRSDITHLADLYQKKVRINIRTQLKILEKKRAAYRAAEHYHRPHLIKSHNEDAKKNIEQRSKENPSLLYEDSLRSVLYDIDLMDGVVKDEVAIAVANHFKDEMNKATESDNPMDNLIVATQMARYEEAIRAKYSDDDSEEVEWVERDGCTFVKDPETGEPKEGEYGNKTPITDWNINVERDEDGEITKVTEQNYSSPERNKEGVEEAQEKIKEVTGCGGIPAEGGDVLADGENESDSQESEWDKGKVEQSIADAMDAYGSTAATGASTQETRGFKAEGDSVKEETIQEKLDRIRADMAIKAEEVATINASGLYGVHINDIKVLRDDQLEPLVRSAPINLLLNQTRDIRGQAYARVGNPSSKTWRTRLGDMQVFKRPPDTLGDVVVMTDMSGSMGCGCQTCFSYEEAAARTCSMVNMHIGRDSNEPLIHNFPYEGQAGDIRYSHISNGE